MAAQIQMPDPKQMAGIPRPVDDLPTGSVSVRLIRGELSNNIANHPVELRVGENVQTAKTDEAGRAQFDKLPAGATLKAVAVVDGERLESQEFPAPARGGIRLMLVATDKEKEARAAEAARAPAVAAPVVLGGETRIVIEPGYESVQLYYLLDIQNNERAPVNPPTPFVFDMPKGARGTAILEGSSPLAKAIGSRVQVAGPFPPGRTSVHVGYELSVTTGDVEISQRFPAALEHLAVIAKKVGDARLSSPQIARQQEMPAQGETYIAAAGDAIAAGQPLVLTLSGLPHHSTAPMWIALLLAVGILLAGLWAEARPRHDHDNERERGAERKRLLARREKLFQDFVRLESDERQRHRDPARYQTRREQLLEALEQVYGALETDDTSPEPASRAGLAA